MAGANSVAAWLSPPDAVENPLGAAAWASGTAMAMADATAPGRPIVFANDAYLALTGYDREEVVGRGGDILQGPGTDEAARTILRDAIDDGRPVSVELLNYRKTGEAFWNALNLEPLRDGGGRVAYWVATLRDISERRAATADGMRDLEAALNAKSALLHEVDHRVKNNLQLISSLLVLQSRRVADPALRTALRGMLERVNAIATVHRRLFQSADVERFDLADFVRDLAADLMAETGRSDIALHLDLEPVSVPAAQAAPLALIINELFANALRHGFRDGGGRLDAAIRRRASGFEIEVVQDRASADAASGPGFGLTIVDLLCQQLSGRWRLEAAQPGVRAIVNLPTEVMV